MRVPFNPIASILLLVLALSAACSRPPSTAFVYVVLNHTDPQSATYTGFPASTACNEALHVLVYNADTGDLITTASTTVLPGQGMRVFVPGPPTTDRYLISAHCLDADFTHGQTNRSITLPVKSVEIRPPNYQDGDNPYQVYEPGPWIFVR